MLYHQKNKNPFFQCRQMKHFHQYLIQTPKDMFLVIVYERGLASMIFEPDFYFRVYYVS